MTISIVYIPIMLTAMALLCPIDEEMEGYDLWCERFCKSVCIGLVWVAYFMAKSKHFI